jgi:hypothetical protein
MEDYIIVKCPHCDKQVIIKKNEINCAIFRHGVYRGSGEQMNPHASKEECEMLVATGGIYGCGKPFRVNTTDFSVSVCDYV